MADRLDEAMGLLEFAYGDMLQQSYPFNRREEAEKELRYAAARQAVREARCAECRVGSGEARSRRVEAMEVAIKKARRGVNGTATLAAQVSRLIEELELLRGRAIGVDDVLRLFDPATPEARDD